MLEVEIHDFQSIEHEKIVLDGFTALVGRSNIGKSAVIRAVKAALTGAPADMFVRHGSRCLRTVKGSKTCKCYCSVHLKADGFDLLWEKGDAVNRYVFNGVDKTAANRGTPEFLGDQFASVKIGDEKKMLQVSDQFFPIFLLDKPGTVIADVLSDVARLDRINTAIRLAEKDRREAASARKLREKDVQELRMRVADFQGLEDATASVARVEQVEKAVQAQADKAAWLEQYVTDVYTMAREVKSLGKATSVPAPEVSDLHSAGERFEEVQRFELSFKDRETKVRDLLPVATVEPPDAAPLRNKSSEFERLARFEVGVSERQAAVERLSPVSSIEPPVPEFDRFFETLSKCDAWLNQLYAFKELFARWKGLDGLVAPDVEPVVEKHRVAVLLSSLTRSLEGVQAEIARLEQAESRASEDEAQAKAEIDALGVCPTCAQPLSGAIHPCPV